MIHSIVPWDATITFYTLSKEGTLSIPLSPAQILFFSSGYYDFIDLRRLLQYQMSQTSDTNWEQRQVIASEKRKTKWYLALDMKPKEKILINCRYRYFEKLRRLPCGNHFSLVKVEPLNNNQLHFYELICINHSTPIVKAIIPTALLNSVLTMKTKHALRAQYDR